MIADGRAYGQNENLTLAEADLSAIGQARPTAGGKKLRAFCPIHGSDHQRSLEVDMGTGRFFCHSCAAWGYMDWAREDFRRERGLERDASQRSRRRPPVRRPPPAPPRKPVEPVRNDLEALMTRFREALPGSLGEKYLRYRGVSLDAAREYGIGYAARGTWPHRGRDWRWGRIVAPHTRPDGTMVSLYGRAVGSAEKVPKQMRHDHLPGSKGYWNARVLRYGSGPLYVVEGFLDALALIASGCERTVAIFSARDWRWHWLPEDVRRLVIAFDEDETGVDAREKVAAEARLLGREVAYLDAESYGGEKDAAAAHAKGVLRIGEWPEPEPAPDAAPAWDEEWAEKRFEDALNFIALRDAFDPFARRHEEYEARLAVPRQAGDRGGYEAALREMIRECLQDASGDGALSRRQGNTDQKDEVT